MYTWLKLNSGADLEALCEEIPEEYAPKRIVGKLRQGISGAVKAILVERNYTDKDYRSVFYNFYAKKGRSYRHDCIRLHFFDGSVSFHQKGLRFNYNSEDLKDHYFGYMVLRPTEIATIGRSVLSPNVRTGAKGYIIDAEHKVHLLGHKLTVRGFPSMDQHIDISVCAHVACWSILRHYSERYSAYRECLTHDITVMAEDFDPGGLVPSRGLRVSHAERVFQRAGTFPVHVARTGDDDLPFRCQLLAYLESGFPLFAAMHEKGHAAVIMGHDWRQPLEVPVTEMRYAWDEVNSLIAVDDSFLPYQAIPVQGSNPYSAREIDAFIVALPEKVYYPADAVHLLAPTLLAKFGQLLGLPSPDETIIRYFITTGSALRQFMRDRESEFDPRLLEIVMSLPFAQFVWVVEFATGEDWRRGGISGRAVVDATASLREGAPLWLFHSRERALVNDRRTIGAGGWGALALSGMEDTALTRWEQNRRTIQGK